ncbi:hypothetical protein HDU76_011058 [Blyttiomyces sp. JEL0837]|nr:hypothetical protein HDU76_011058 [Blyttiomyces sp. JEL0837]
MTKNKKPKGTQEKKNKSKKSLQQVQDNASAISKLTKKQKKKDKNNNKKKQEKHLGDKHGCYIVKANQKGGSRRRNSYHEDCKLKFVNVDPDVDGLLYLQERFPGKEFVKGPLNQALLALFVSRNQIKEYAAKDGSRRITTTAVTSKNTPHNYSTTSALTRVKNVTFVVPMAIPSSDGHPNTNPPPR